MKRVKRRVTRDLTDSLAALKSALREVTNTRGKFSKHSVQRGVSICNAAQFFLLTQYDIQVLGHDAILSDDDDRKNLYCRLMALTLVETAEDLAQILGRAFRDDVAVVYDDAALDQRLLDWTKALGSFRTTHDKDLREIRNYASAHREKDAAEQLRVLQSVDCKKILDVGGEFVTLSRVLLRLLADLMFQSKHVVPRLMPPKK